MITINKLIANSIVITTGPVDDGKTRVKYTTESGHSDWEGDIVGELADYSIPNISDAEVVEIGSHVTSIGESAFIFCTELKSATIPAGVTSIGFSAFSGCSGLTSVTIGDGVISIGTSAFDSCTNLTGIVIPDSVASIGDHAFYQCSELTSVTIGTGMTSIDYDAFMACNDLTSVTFSGKTKSTVQGMANYSWGLPSGCTIHCTDGNITV